MVLGLLGNQMQKTELKCRPFSFFLALAMYVWCECMCIWIGGGAHTCEGPRLAWGMFFSLSTSLRTFLWSLDRHFVPRFPSLVFWALELMCVPPHPLSMYMGSGNLNSSPHAYGQLLQSLRYPQPCFLFLIAFSFKSCDHSCSWINNILLLYVPL